MTVAIRRQLGVSIGIGDIVAAPTVRQLAPRLDNGQVTQWSPLMGLRREGTLVPIFLTHPAVGDVVGYRGLLDHLPAQQPLYTFEAAGMDGKSAPDASLAAMAERYVRSIKTVSGPPYKLGGWSSGGLICFEMARQLVETGDEVTHLLLFDTPAPHTTGAPTPDMLLHWFLDDLHAGVDVEQLDMSGPLPAGDGLYTLIKSAMRQFGSHLPPMPEEILMPVVRVFFAIALSTTTYAPPPLPVFVQLVRATTFVHKSIVPLGSDNWDWPAHTADVEVRVHWLEATRHTLLGDATMQLIAAVLAESVTIAAAGRMDEAIGSQSEDDGKVTTAADAGMAEDPAWDMAAPDIAQEKRRAEAARSLQSPKIDEVTVEALVALMHRVGLTVDGDAPFTRAGLNSLQALELRNALQRAVGERVTLPLTLLFEQSNVRQVVKTIDRMLGAEESPTRQPDSQVVSSTPLSIITLHGTSSRLPCTNLSSTLLRGVDTVSGRDSFDGVDGFWLDCPELFDARCFSIGNDEANNMDPQQRHVRYAMTHMPATSLHKHALGMCMHALEVHTHATETYTYAHVQSCRYSNKATRRFTRQDRTEERWMGAALALQLQCGIQSSSSCTVTNLSTAI